MMIYRIALENDVSAISDLFDEVYRKDYFIPRSRIERMVSGKVEPRFGKRLRPYKVYLACENNEVVGVAICSPNGNLDNLLVRKDYRKRGIGSQLIKLASPRLIRCKIDNTDGDPTAFYEKNGYSHIGNFDLWGKLPLDGKKSNIKLMVKAQVSR